MKAYDKRKADLVVLYFHSNLLHCFNAYEGFHEIGWEEKAFGLVNLLIYRCGMISVPNLT